MEICICQKLKMDADRRRSQGKADQILIVPTCLLWLIIDRCSAKRESGYIGLILTVPTCMLSATSDD